MSNESSLPHLVDQAEESLEEARFNEMRNVPSSAQSDAQENLDQASMAVNDALRRLQDLRTSIANLSGGTQNETTAHVPNPSIGPSHSAILLSDAASDDVPDSEAVPEMGRLRSTIPSAIMDRLEEFEATTHQRLANLGSVGSSSATHRPQNLDSTGRSVVGPSSRPHHVFREPPLPDLVLPPRRSWLEPSLSRRRDIEDDDASTGLGRRVAARIAADTHSSSPQVTNGTTDTSRASLRHAVSRVENSRVSTAGLEPVAVARRFHDRQAAPRPRSSTAAREAELVRRLEEARAISLRARNIISSSQSGDSSRAGTAENATMRRWHFGEVSGSGENRYSIPEDPDSISWWNSINIATNTGSSSGRPQDQPNVLPMNPGNPSPEPRTFEETARYLRRRRQDAEEGEQLRARSGDRDQGEEWSTRLLSRSTEQGRSPPGWTETSARWNSLNPLQSRSERQPPPQLTMDAYLEAYQASAPNAPRRRRGWARLDADGNEIPSEEEDVLENARTRSRARAVAGVRPATPTEFETIRTLVPMTRTSHPESWDGEGVIARVRIRPSRQAADVADSHGKGKNCPSYSTPAFKADPLPMPLVDMIPQPGVRRKPISITSVRPHASLAGR